MKEKTILIKSNSIYGSRRATIKVIHRLIEEGKVEIGITAKNGKQEITYKFKEMELTKVTWQEFVEHQMKLKEITHKQLCEGLFIKRQNLNSKVFNNPTQRTMNQVLSF